MSLVECIHGLEQARCDSCTPKAPPAAPVRAVRATRAPRTDLRGSAAKAAPSAGAPAKVDPGEQRIYHLTHLDNLPGILQHGLRCAADEAVKPAVDISPAETRAQRRAATVTDDATVDQFVPFFLTVDSAYWQGMRTRAGWPPLSADARRLPASEFVLLVSTVGRCDPDASAVAHGDAGERGTRIVVGGLGRQLGAVANDADALAEAEFLVPNAVPVEAITLIGVANDRSRDRVKELLQSAAHAPKVVVHPPWFMPTASA